MSEESRIEKGGDKAGKTVGEGLKKGIGAIKDFGKNVADKVDVTCDNCGKAMKPGGSVKKTFDGKEHQFCSEACVTAWKPTSRAK